MRKLLITGVEAPHLRKNPLKFEIGDTVQVDCRIREGTKDRIQPFIGIVIAQRGAGMNEMFTVRRIVMDEGVERIFPLHSPAIADVKVIRSGKSRRAKLYYLRDLRGKAAKIREKRSAADEVRTVSDPAPVAVEEVVVAEPIVEEVVIAETVEAPAEKA